MKHSALFAGFAAVFLASTPAGASLIAIEGFDSYTTGSQLEPGGVGLNGGTGWADRWAVNDTYTANLTIQNKALSYSGGAVSVSGGTKALRISGINSPTGNFVFAARPVENQTGPLYYSFLFRHESDKADVNDFLQVGFSNTSETPPISVGYNANAGVHDFFARVTTTSGNSTFTGVSRPEDATYFIVAKLTKVSGSTNYNRVDLWVSPTSLTETAPTAFYYNSSQSSGKSILSHFMLREAFPETADVFWMDEIRVGSTYDSVIPEPATLALLGLGAGLTYLSRRRRG